MAASDMSISWAKETSRDILRDDLSTLGISDGAWYDRAKDRSGVDSYMGSVYLLNRNLNKLMVAFVQCLCENT